MTWKAHVADFFDDVNTYGYQNGVGIKNVVISFVFGAGGALYQDLQSTDSRITFPLGSPCDGMPGTVRFYPMYPVGVAISGYPLFWNDPNAYNCAPTNPFFIGWTNGFGVIDAVLAAAQAKGIRVAELEAQQELNISGFTSEMRLIYDNSNPQSVVDVLGQLRQKMTDHTFDPGLVTWSGGWTDSSLTYVSGPDKCNLVDSATGTCNCLNVYGDYSRQFALDSIAAAIGGGQVGLGENPDFQPTDTGGLVCGGSTANMIYPPIYYSQPSVVDSHMYPHIEYPGDNQSERTDTHVQQAAKVDYSDLQHLLALFGIPTALIGETHRGTPNTDTADGCWVYPTTAATDNVAGFNQSALSGYSVVFQPWMELQDSTGLCYPYYPAGQSSYQNVNYGGNGPYTPTRYQ